MPVGNDAGGTDNLARERAADVVPSRTRTLHTMLVALGLSLAVAAVPSVAKLNPATGANTGYLRFPDPGR